MWPTSRQWALVCSIRGTQSNSNFRRTLRILGEPDEQAVSLRRHAQNVLAQAGEIHTHVEVTHLNLRLRDIPRTPWHTVDSKTHHFFMVHARFHGLCVLYPQELRETFGRRRIEKARRAISDKVV